MLFKFISFFSYMKNEEFWNHIISSKKNDKLNKGLFNELIV